MEKYSLEFRGNSYIEMPYDEDFDLTGNSVTLEAWVKTDRRSIGRVISKSFSSNTTVNSVYELSVQSNGNLRFAIGGVFDINNTLVADGNWHHIAGTYDGNEAKMYVDGQLVNTHNRAGSIRKSTEPIMIGIAKYGNDARYGIIGEISQPRVWDGVLSEEEIKDNMKHVTPESQQELKLFYETNKRDGEVLTDYNTGKIANSNRVIWKDFTVDLEKRYLLWHLIKSSDRVYTLSKNSEV